MNKRNILLGIIAVLVIILIVVIAYLYTFPQVNNMSEETATTSPATTTTESKNEEEPVRHMTHTEAVSGTFTNNFQLSSQTTVALPKSWTKTHKWIGSSKGRMIKFASKGSDLSLTITSPNRAYKCSAPNTPQTGDDLCAPTPMNEWIDWASHFETDTDADFSTYPLKPNADDVWAEGSLGTKYMFHDDTDVYVVHFDKNMNEQWMKSFVQNMKTTLR